MRKSLFSLIMLTLLCISATASAQRTVQGIERHDLSPLKSKHAPRLASGYYTSNGSFNFDNITTWYGQGAKKAALIIQWNDPREENAIVFGFRWDGDIKPGEAWEAVAAANPHLIMAGETSSAYGGTIQGFGWDADGNGNFQITDGTNTLTSPENGYLNMSVGDGYTAVNPDDYWAGGWYDGYWSYWSSSSFDEELSYSQVGAYYDNLSDGALDAWNFAVDMQPQAFKPFKAAPTGVKAAAKVKVTMNSISKTMTLKEKATGKTVITGDPTDYTYNFEVPAGEYTLTGVASDGVTINGSLDITVDDTEEEQEFKVLTITAYVTNKHDNGNTWTLENGDYGIDLKVNDRDGAAIISTIGKSTVNGRNTFLALNGNSYYIEFIPSEKHKNDGYVSLHKNGTLTFNANVNGAIPMSDLLSVTVPEGAGLQIGRKGPHFTDFMTETPATSETKDGNTIYTYRLALSQTYNYRTWMKGGVTKGGYFTMSANESDRPELIFTEPDYMNFDPHTVNHDVQSNKGYETGDIFLNINHQGHLNLNIGDTFNAHAMRTWELTDNSVNNYFIEPDFHYTVVDLYGQPSTDIIEIEETPGSAWAKIKAKQKGTAIVLVTYDAISLNYYNKSEKKEYLGGENWGAIWPENTGVYVVSVGEPESTAISNMTINEKYNEDSKKLAGKYVDAEHDVFYYLDTEEGHVYTFAPDRTVDVTIAYPSVKDNVTSYAGFGTDGVSKNADGSYSILLKEGRQIVRMEDISGNAAYQVLTAKKCHREITNLTREGSDTFEPGDQIKIQYSGLRHPANKLAGIYNMSAYVTYNGVPNGTSLILGANQYTFGSAAKAQAVTFDIPSDTDVTTTPEIVLSDGVIQVNGYGDPIGNHRYINPTSGRSPNFTAIAHKTYFGYIPEVRIPLGTKIPTDVNSISINDNMGETIYYNMQGMSSDRPFEGLNIIRYGNGTTKKVYIR